MHAELAAAFDWEHRDPWDRILAAQTRLEHCALISTDAVFDAVLQDRYGEEKVVRILVDVTEAADGLRS